MKLVALPVRQPASELPEGLVTKLCDPFERDLRVSIEVKFPFVIKINQAKSFFALADEALHVLVYVRVQGLPDQVADPLVNGRFPGHEAVEVIADGGVSGECAVRLALKQVDVDQALREAVKFDPAKVAQLAGQGVRRARLREQPVQRFDRHAETENADP